jgi:uroporphyrinogen-III synthase
VPCREALAAGAETGRALAQAGVPAVRVPLRPGAVGILADLPGELPGVTVLWPRASDAEDAPLAELRARGARVVAPVVYEKRPLERLDPDLVEAFFEGGYTGVAVASLASLDVLISHGPGRPLPQVRWGVLGPETARLFVERGLPAPLVPERPSLERLVELLRTTV